MGEELEECLGVGLKPSRLAQLSQCGDDRSRVSGAQMFVPVRDELTLLFA